MTALLLDHMGDAARRIATGDYEGDQATVDVHLVGAQWRRRAIVEHGLQSLMGDGYASCCQQAHDAGDGDQDIAATYEQIVSPPALLPGRPGCSAGLTCISLKRSL